MPLFTDLNKMLQSDEPKLHVLHDSMQIFLRKLLGRFVRAEVLTTTNITGIDVDDDSVLLRGGGAGGAKGRTPPQICRQTNVIIAN